MYFWNVRALEDDLKNRRVSQREKMHYYLATMLVYVVAVYANGITATPANDFAIVTLLACFVITIWGIRRCYDTNSQGDNEEFIDRMMCMSWPVTVRMLAVFLPAYLVLFIFLSIASNDPDTGFVDAVATSLYSIYFYKWMQVCLRRISASAVTAPTPLNG